MTDEVEVKQEQAVDAPKRVARPIEPNRMRGGEFIRVIYCVTAFDDTQPEDLLVPEYWAHCAQTFKPWDRIEAVANDGTWWAELVVLESGRNWTRMHLMRKHNLTTADVAQSQMDSLLLAYDVKHRGPHCKWSVVRRSDKQVLHEFAETKASAEAWLNSHLAAMK